MLLHLARAFVLFSFLFSGLTVAQKVGQQIPITIRENQIYVKTYINGRGPYTFRLDSDLSGVGRLDYRVAKELQLNIVGYQENSDAYQVKREILVAVTKLSLGPITHSNLKLIASDYRLPTEPIPVDGVMGRDFFQDYLLTIDGPGRQLIVSNGRLAAHDKGVLPYQKPFLIVGKVGQKELFFQLDTGSNFSLHFPAYLLAGVHYADTPDKREITKANATFSVQEAILTDELTLGSIKVINQKIYYSGKANQVYVGEAFLKEHSLTIDQRRKLLRID